MKYSASALLFLFLFSSCNTEEKIFKLLNSKDKEDVILGAFKAGESKNKKFAPLLLRDAVDVRTSTNIRFKGFNVYQQKMYALEKIFNNTPPMEITNKPDSQIINYYTTLYKNLK